LTKTISEENITPSGWQNVVIQCLASVVSKIQCKPYVSKSTYPAHVYV